MFTRAQVLAALLLLLGMFAAGYKFSEWQHRPITIEWHVVTLPPHQRI